MPEKKPSTKKYAIILCIAVTMLVVLYFYGNKNFINYSCDASEDYGEKLDIYFKSINYSCNVDSDCAVVGTVRNCCGYVSGICANINAKVNQNYVNSLDNCIGQCLCESFETKTTSTCKCSGNLCIMPHRGILVARIDTASQNQILIRNAGSQELSSSVVTIYINGTLTQCTFSPDPISIGGLGTCILELPCTSKRIKVTTPTSEDSRICT